MNQYFQPKQVNLCKKRIHVNILLILFFYYQGPEFPRELPSVVKKMFSQMFKLFAHIYHVHYDKVMCLNEEPHFNSLFAHFISFAREFDLLDRKDVQPLNELIDVMSKNGVIC